MDPEELIESPKSQKRRSPLFDLFWNVLIVAAIVVTVRTFIAAPYIVDGQSMQPTLENDDFLLTERLSTRFDRLQRGDIVVFLYPGNIAERYVKRIIGLPGDRIAIRDGQVLVNDIALQEPYTSSSTFTRQVNQWTVPEESYFVLGDNRQNSSDSREWGFVPHSNVIGRVSARFFPLGEATWISHARYSNL